MFVSERRSTMGHSPSTVIASSQLSRRQFLQGVASLGLSAAGLALLPGCASQPALRSEEETLETTTIRLIRAPSICTTPQFFAEDLLKAEGFTEVQYVKEATAFGTSAALVSGEADINMA